MKQILIAITASLCLVSSAYSFGETSSAFEPGEHLHRAVTFKISNDDIAKVDFESNSLTIKLNPAATKRLAAITAANLGKMMVLYYQDVRVMHAQINGVSRNGLIYVQNPTDDMKRHLAPFAAGT